MNLNNHPIRPIIAPAIIPATLCTKIEPIDQAKFLFLLAIPLSYAAYSNAIVLHTPNRIRHVILSNVHDAISDPAIPFDLP
jgi:hypothetical protein